MNGLALCAGAGGLELGLRIALGPDYRCICYVEREAYAAATLVARMEDQTLDLAPVWDDLLTFDGTAWRGTVDIVTAGFPCQPWSVAGKRGQTADERWIWPDIARILRQVEPRWVFLENVPGLVRGGIEYVLGDLAAFGFDAEWDCVSAAEVGASHIRERIFILAYRHHPGCEERRERKPTPTRHPAAECTSSPVGNPDHDGQPERGYVHGWGIEPDRHGRAETMVNGSGERWQDQNPEGAPGSLGRIRTDGQLPPFAPGPEDFDAWREILEKYPRLEPAVCRMADGLAHRTDRLRIIGNGVVPLAAAVAFLRLRARLIGGSA